MDYDRLKLTFIPGLKDIVLEEIAPHPHLEIVGTAKDAVYLSPLQDLGEVLTLRSILNVYIVRQGSELNPYYISHHKSILGNLIELVVPKDQKGFDSFKLSCAGSDSPEVRGIARYIKETYKIPSSEEADLEIYIGKSNTIWEIGVRCTARPLSMRDYRVAHIAGGLNPTIAYAINTFCDLSTRSSYLNICSGSATLLIEAARSNPSLQLVGFDHDGKTNALAVQNIKKAGLLKSIHLKTADILDTPDLGIFDVITSDLPFGMQISKGEDLEQLYRTFIMYVQATLNPNGILVIYTAQPDVFEAALVDSNISISNTINLTLPTTVGAYLRTKILVCTRKR